LVVYFDYDDQLRHIGPVEIDLIVNSKPNARETRYSVRNVRAAWDLSRRSI